jgi:hypothetical protein
VLTEGQGHEEGASLDVQDICRFFTLLDSILTIGESAGGEEQSAWPHPHPGVFLERAGGGARNSMGQTLLRCFGGGMSAAEVCIDWRPACQKTYK